MWCRRRRRSCWNGFMCNAWESLCIEMWDFIFGGFLRPSLCSIWTDFYHIQTLVSSPPYDDDDDGSRLASSYVATCLITVMHISSELSELMSFSTWLSRIASACSNYKCYINAVSPSHYILRDYALKRIGEELHWSLRRQYEQMVRDMHYDTGV